MLVLTVLLRYRPVISFGPRGGALLLGLTCGAMLVAGVVVAVPQGVVPASWQVALGAASADAQAEGTSRAPGTTGPAPALAAVPTTTAAAPATTDAPPTTTAAPTTEQPPTTTPPAPTTTTTPRPAPTTRRAPAPPPAPTGPRAAVVALTNDARAEAGCAPLRTDARLAAAAQGHSEDMASQGYFSHDSKDGRGFDDRIRDAGYDSPGAENIAQGQPDAASVVEAWMNSPGHRRNILDCSLTTIGVGLDGRGNYWTQDFGR